MGKIGVTLIERSALICLGLFMVQSLLLTSFSDPHLQSCYSKLC